MASIPSTTERERGLTVAVPTTPRRTAERVRAVAGAIALYGALGVLALLFLLPFYLIVRNALMTNPEITSFSWNWLPQSLQWQNFHDLFADTSAPMLTGLKNSAIIATVTLVFQLLFASMAGYALARIPARGRNVVFFLLLLTLMIPAAVTFVPEYAVVSYLGGVSTLWGIIVPGLFNVFATFLFRQFYLDFPAELEEAARMDGAGYFRIFWGLLLPNSIGIMVALGALSFIFSWNAFLWPLVIGQQPSSWTVQIVLSTFLTAQTINLAELFMGAAVAAAPLVILFLIMQRYIAEGVRLSGIKG